MANEEIKAEVEQPIGENKTTIHNILFNVTTKVPHVMETLPTVEVQTKPTKALDFRSVEQVNKNVSTLPKFYIREYKRSGRLVVMWAAITILCLCLEIWAMISIINSTVSNWAMLTLIPGITLCITFLVIYANNWIGFRNEARNVDFSKGKIPTIYVMKLYKRLKTAYINVNWFCLLTYVAGGLAILITYIIGWALSRQWGNLDPSLYSCGSALLITVIICSVAMIIAFFLHVILLATNYIRAGKIDAFYSVQIVSDEELVALKKKKNKRDLFIFLAVVLIVALIGILIYKLVKSRKVNNVTINS